MSMRALRSYVILSAAKNLTCQHARSFAALRMTARALLTSQTLLLNTTDILITMNHNLVRVSVLLVPAFVVLGSATSAAEKRPNVLIIVGDDMGYADIGVHGCKDIPTPHIDSIAKNGIRCTSGYVSGPYCSPTRAGLMTGRYQQRFGHEFNPGPNPVQDFGLP